MISYIHTNLTVMRKITSPTSSETRKDIGKISRRPVITNRSGIKWLEDALKTSQQTEAATRVLLGWGTSFGHNFL